MLDLLSFLNSQLFTINHQFNPRGLECSKCLTLPHCEPKLQQSIRESPLFESAIGSARGLAPAHTADNRTTIHSFYFIMFKSTLVGSCNGVTHHKHWIVSETRLDIDAFTKEASVYLNGSCVVGVGQGKELHRNNTYGNIYCCFIWSRDC